jgi:CHAT domain-containing protein
MNCTLSLKALTCCLNKAISLNDKIMCCRMKKYSVMVMIPILFVLLNAVMGEVRQDLQVDSFRLGSLADSAQAYTDKGLECYNADNYENAEKFLLKALDIYLQIYQKGHRKIGNAFINLGANSMQHWKYGEAMSFLDKAEENFDIYQKKYANELGGIYINKGIIYSRIGELNKAKTFHEMALRILLELNDPDSKRIAINLYNSLASINRKLGAYQQGIKYYRMAEELAMQYNKRFLRIIYTNLGNLYAEISDFQKSEYYYQKSIATIQKQRIDQPSALADIYSNYAEMCLKCGRTDKSFRLNRIALDLVNKSLGEKNPLASNINNSFGRYYEARCNYDSALYYYQKSICSLFNDFNDGSIYANPDISETISKTHLLKCLKDKAGAFQKYFQYTANKTDLKASLESYDLAVKLIDIIRMGYQDEDSKLYLNENERITYDEAISVAYRMYKVTGDDRHKHMAFDYSEKSKASVLLSALRDAGAKGFGGIPDTLLKQESDLIRDIAFYSEQLYEEKRKNIPDSLKIDLWERKLFRIKKSNEDLVSLFEKNYPEYYALKYRTGMIAIKDIQRRIKKGATVLEYSLTDAALYAFLITKDHFDIVAQSIDTLFQGTYNSMLGAVGNLDPTRHNAEQFNRFVTSSYGLYKYLIKPLAKEISGQQLIIIPDGILSFIPFEALISDIVRLPEGHLDYKDLPLLLKVFAISYAHSSTLLFEQQINKKEKSSGGLLAFAPSYDGTNSMTFRGTPRYNYRKDLAPIPGAREEVEQIIRLFRGKLFIDDDATELNFKKYAGDYDILHMAMHAVINNQNPMYSKLVFTATSDSTEDNLLNTHEIYNLNLKARMVVLSSCSSGEGILQKGEGVISLARGFSYAGCPGLIMTLWEVEDKVSADLMIGFYRYLKKGYPKDQALQKAKLDFIYHHAQLLSHPFYWSAYQCIGDSSPLCNPAKKYIYILISVGIAVIIFILTLRYNRLKKKA